MEKKKCAYCKSMFEPSKFSPNQQKFCNKKCKWNYYNKINQKKKINNYAEMRKNCLNIIGKKCCACSNEDYYVLQIDHINSDRSKDKSFKEKYKLYLKIIKNHEWAKAKYQTLCCNCNFLKQFYPKIFKERFPSIK